LIVQVVAGETSVGVSISVVVTSSVGETDGVFLGVFAGDGFGVLVGDAAGATTGVLLLTGARNGEVRGGRVGVVVGLAGTEGLTEAGGLIACGGSDPGE